MWNRCASARLALVASALFLVCTSDAASQRLSPPRTVASPNTSIVVLVRPEAIASRSRVRSRSLARNLTTREKAVIVNAAFPRGIPEYPPVKDSLDPAGLSTQVVLTPSHMSDTAFTAGLYLSNAHFSPPMGGYIPGGVITLSIGDGFAVQYRPARVGAPIMIECQLDGIDVESKVNIDVQAQGAAVANEATISRGDETLAFVVLPKSIGLNAVGIGVQSGNLELHACAVTPLS